MSFTVHDDRVVIKWTREEKVMDSGLVLTANSQGFIPIGKVVAAGPGRTNSYGVLIPMDIKEGDMVVFNRSAVEDTNIMGEDYYTGLSDCVLAIVEDYVP